MAINVYCPVGLFFELNTSRFGASSRFEYSLLNTSILTINLLYFIMGFSTETGKHMHIFTTNASETSATYYTKHTNMRIDYLENKGFASSKCSL